MKKYMMMYAVVAGLLTSPVGASDKKEEVKVEPSTSISEQQIQMDKTQVIVEAVKVLEQTNVALQQLNAGEKQKALDTMALIVGKLELIVAQHPDLVLAPVDVQVVVHDYVGDKKAVKSISKEARELLKDGQVQQARYLLKDLASEIVVRTTNLPLLTYPALMESVVPMIDQGDVVHAQALLQQSLSTVVVVDDILPLPVLRAEALLAEAAILAEDGERDERANEMLASLLQEASEQLEWAEILGYGDEKSFEALYKSITQIEDKTEDGGQEKGLFEELQSRITKLLRG